MSIFHTICDCGANISAHGADDFDAQRRAFAKRALCREADPQLHETARRVGLHTAIQMRKVANGVNRSIGGAA